MDLTNPVSQGPELAGGHVAEDGVEDHHDGGDAVEGPQCPQCGELTIVDRIEEGKPKQRFPNAVVENLEHQTAYVDPAKCVSLMQISEIHTLL